MNCDRSENVSSYFKLEPQTQNKQIKNANGFSPEQMRAGCYDHTPTMKRAQVKPVNQSILGEGNSYFNTPRKMGPPQIFPDQFSAGFEPGDTCHYCH